MFAALKQQEQYISHTIPQLHLNKIKLLIEIKVL